MNKWSIAAAVTMCLLTTSAVGVHAAATQPAKSAELAISGYFDVAIRGNVEAMMRLSNDQFYVDEEAELDGLTRNHQNNPLVAYKVLSKKEVDSTHVEFTVQTTYKHASDLPPLNFMVVEENGEWQVIIEPIEINKVLGSPDYGKVKKSQYKLQKAQPVTGMTP